MARVIPLLNNFTSGELSPRLDARVDFELYRNGAADLTNFLVQPQGGASRRPGTKYIDATPSNNPVRLLPFVYSEEQAYVVMASDREFRFYRDQAIYNEPGTTDPLVLQTPYKADELDAIRYVQSADIMWLVHKDRRVRRLERFTDEATGLDNFRIVSHIVEDGPWFEQNSTDIRITADKTEGVTGDLVTLTATGDVFLSGHVGALWRLEDAKGTISEPEWKENKGYQTGDRVSYDGRVYEAQANATSGEIPPEHEDGVWSDKENKQGVPWKYLNQGFGIVEITEYVSATEVKGVTLVPLPKSIITGEGDINDVEGTVYWSEGAWSNARGYPREVTFFEERLVFAASIAQPQALWFSRTNDFASFADIDSIDRDIVADAAITLQLSSNTVNEIRWLMPQERLLVGTGTGPFTVRASTLDEPLSPTNVQARLQGREGASDLKPVASQSAVIYSNQNRRRIYQMGYAIDASDSGAYTAQDITILSEHITSRSGVKDMTISYDPSEIVWFVRNDGQLLTLTYNRLQRVLGWARQKLGGDGQVESVVSIPGSAALGDNDVDDIWVSVRREIDGNVRRYLEVFAKGYDEDKGDDRTWYVDSGIKATKLGTKSFGGLDHLAGAEVSVLADGDIHPNVTVQSDGTIALEYDADDVIAGLPYESLFRTMKLAYGAVVGTAIAQEKRTYRFDLIVHNALGGAYSSGDGKLYPIPYRQMSDDTESSPSITSEEIRLVNRGRWERDPRLVIRHDQPVPFTMLGLAAHITTSDK